MRLRLQFRRYRLPFQVPVRTAHGPWSEREGLIIRLEDHSEGGSGAVGFGEAAPIPWFGTETIDQAETIIRELGEWVDTAGFETVPPTFLCVRHALSSACDDLRRSAEAGAGKALPEDSARYLSVAALLPAGRAALAQIGPKAEVGFRVFKWKVGVADLADELALLDDVCAQLPAGAKLRLDANGAWDRRRAERWLERCADRPVEFVEQPCSAPASARETQQRKMDDLLLGLAEDYPTPIALDESLVGDADLDKWVRAGWRGIFVVKPALVGDIGAAFAKLERAHAKVVFSSALETAVGAKSALQAAFAWKGEADPSSASNANPAAEKPRRTRALGFGVWPLFTDPKFDGPAAAPYVRQEDVAKIDVSALWTALS